MKGENKSSMQGSDNRKGHQAETVKSVEKVGSSDGNGIRFSVPAHHEHCDVKGGGAVKTPGG